MALKLRKDYEPRFIKNTKTNEWEHSNKPPIDRRISKLKRDNPTYAPQSFKIKDTSQDGEIEEEDIQEKEDDFGLDRLEKMDTQFKNLVLFANKLTKIISRLRKTLK